MNIFNFIKQIFCSHNYVFKQNIYGDEINNHNGNRSIWQCSKCGKIIYKKDQKLDINDTLSLDTELVNLTDNYYRNIEKEWEKSHAKLINYIIADLKRNAKKGLNSWEGYIILKNDSVKYFKDFFERQHLEIEMKMDTKSNIDTKEYYVTIYWDKLRYYD